MAGKATDRSLGFVPLLIMTVLWLFLTQFKGPIGQVTSRTGYFNPNAAPPNYGCRIPRAKP